MTQPRVLLAVAVVIGAGCVGLLVTDSSLAGTWLTLLAMVCLAGSQVLRMRE